MSLQYEGNLQVYYRQYTLILKFSSTSFMMTFDQVYVHNWFAKRGTANDYWGVTHNLSRPEDVRSAQ